MKLKIKNNLEYILILFTTILIILFTTFYIKHLKEFIKIPRCILYEKTEIYCLGCGATRAVYSLISGDILKSIYYNPFILYIITIDGWYLITESISKILKKKNKFFIKNINLYLYLGILILILNWLIKIIMLKYMGITLN